MSRSNPPSRPASASSFSRPNQQSDAPSGSSSTSDYSTAFGPMGTILKSKTREPQSAPTTRRSTPQPLHATPGVRVTQAKAKASHGGAVVSDLLGGGSGGAKPVKAEVKKPEKLSEKAEALSIRIRDVESVEFDEQGGSNVSALGKRQLKKAKGGCFCQARVHPLSPYTPLCPSCSLPLCLLQPPHLPCPSCSSSLLTPSSRTRLLSTLNDDLSSLLASEQRERDRLEELRKENLWRESAGGKFPVLAAGIVKGNKEKQKELELEGKRKVMSMNAKTGRFEVKTFVKRPSAATTPDGGSDLEGGGGPSRVPSPELYEGRIKAPRMGYPTAEERSERVREVLGVRQRERRFFLDVDGLEIGYVEPRKVVVEDEVGAVGEETKKGKGRKRGRGKGKGKENDEAAAAEQHGRVDQEEEAEESAPEQIITSLDEAPAPDDLTPEERAWLGLPSPSLPPNPSAPTFTPRPTPTPSAPSHLTSPNPARLAHPTPSRRAPPSHLPPDSIHLPPSTTNSSRSSSTAPTAYVSDGRFSVSRVPPIKLLVPGTRVLVIKKEDQGSGKTSGGEVAEVLTRGDHPRGVKVRCKGGMVGRVVGIAK